MERRSSKGGVKTLWNKHHKKTSGYPNVLPDPPPRVPAASQAPPLPQRLWDVPSTSRGVSWAPSAAGDVPALPEALYGETGAHRPHSPAPSPARPPPAPFIRPARSERLLVVYRRGEEQVLCPVSRAPRTRARFANRVAAWGERTVFLTRSSSLTQLLRRPPLPRRKSSSSRQSGSSQLMMTSEKDEATGASGETARAPTPPPESGSAPASAPASTPAASPTSTPADAGPAAAGEGASVAVAAPGASSKEAAAEVVEAAEKEDCKEAAAEPATEAKEGKEGKEAKEGKGDAAAAAAAAAAAQRMVKSVVLTGYGGFEKMKVKSWALPNVPAAGQVEVAVSHCGVNFADVYMRRGVQRERSPPCVMGLECSGTVTAIGEGVENIKPGDRVVCYQHTGDLYRETVVIPANNVFPLPEGMSLEHGAALVVDYLTAYFCLMDIANLRPGQSLLINSCAEGVGWAVTQLARTVEGVSILGTAASSKHEAVKENGVTHPLNMESFEQELSTHCPQGVDIIIDSAAGSNISANLRLLKPLGRLIIIGMNSVVIGHQKPGLMDMLRNLWSVKTLSTMDLVMGNRSVAGFHLGKIFELMPDRFKQALDFVFEQYAAGRVQPRIDSEIAFEQVVDAAKRLAERESIGKVLLKVNSESKKAEE